MTHFTPVLLLAALLFSLTHVALCIPITIKSVDLTPMNSSQNGVNVSISQINNETSINTAQNEWDIECTLPPRDPSGFHLEIYLDHTWAFHPNKTSIISYTMHSSTPVHDADTLIALLSFSVDHATYITLQMQHKADRDLSSYYNNEIYPKCRLAVSVADGNIKQIMDSPYRGDVCTDDKIRRKCFATNGFAAMPMFPANLPNHTNRWPTTVTLENNPINDTLLVSLTNPYWEFKQRCRYTSFPAGKNVQIYFGLDRYQDAAGNNKLSFSNFNISYYLYDTTTRKQSKDDTSVIPIKQSGIYTLVSVVLLSMFMVTGIIGYIDATWCSHNDLFSVSAIIICGFYAIDFLSDVFFAATVYSNCTANSNNIYLWVICIATCVFLVLPLIINLFQLRYSMTTWMDDIENGLSIKIYLEENSRMVYTLTMISGSGFAAVRVLNSALFRITQFEMGLKKHQMRQFQTKRLFSVVLLENVPQILLQMTFAVVMDKMYAITMISLVFSLLSVILCMFEYSTTRSIIKHNATSCNVYSVRMDAVSSHILKHRKALRYQTNKINAYMAGVMEINEACVEQLKAGYINNGLRLSFRMRLDKKDTVQSSGEVYDAIHDKIQNGSFAEAVKSAWRLLGDPSIQNLNVNPIRLTVAASGSNLGTAINITESHDDSDQD